MPELISAPHLIPVPGNKIIEEYVGRVNNRESQVSVARMRSPAGWSEPGQRPDFDEFTRSALPAFSVIPPSKFPSHIVG